jgi:hypothetical protein
MENINVNNTNSQDIVKRFLTISIDFIKDVKNKYKEVKNDKGQSKIFRNQYKFIKKNGDCNFICIYELFQYEPFKIFNEEDKKIIYESGIKKIRGIFKHGQAGKTEISCEKIESDIKKDIITIALTKNTLLAKTQFVTRFIKKLKNAGYTNLKDKVMIISSDKDNLGGNATHCKNIDEAWRKICQSQNQYKVIFMCSNSTRINDICDLLELYNNSNDNIYKKKIVIQYDEAHNKISGIPTCRADIEYMLLFDIVHQLVPITASGNPINDENNPLWKDVNIKKMKLNYINQDLLSSQIKSDNPNYSSINDAIALNFEDTYSNKEFDNSFKRETFDKIYEGKTNFDKMGRPNACDLAFLGDEERAMNCAKNILENNTEISYSVEDETESIIHNVKIFIPDKFNLHLMLTPGRKIISRELMEFAAKQSYNPIVIAFYDSKIHYMFRDIITNQLKISKENGIVRKENEEFNECLYRWLQEKKFMERCIIIIGNYQCVGESNTFVNSNYGYLRSVILLPGCKCTKEENYQFFLRSCFLLQRFQELNKNNITKFIIGTEEAIADAYDYEKINDEIVQDLLDSPEEERDFIYDLDISTENRNNLLNNENDINFSIPVQYKIEDYECEYVQKIKEIMNISQRTPENKKEFMESLLKSLERESIKQDNKNKNILNNNYPLSRFTLSEFRCYNNTLIAENYRFKSCYDNFHLNTSYKTGDLQKNECAIYCCLHRHIDDRDINNIHINNPNTFYMFFAY